MASLPPDAPKPRQCRIRKDFPEQDYGFNLHADRNRGQYIGSIDAGSAAESSGLRTGDRIVAVNGVSVATDVHKQVVARIKEHSLECSLLVIDEFGECWYRERKLPIPVYQDFGNGSSVDQKRIVPLSSIVVNSSAASPPTYQDVANGQQQNQQPLSTTMKNNQLAQPLLRPKLCKLVKPYSDVEYGFNLHAERNTGHYIWKVDRNSVAEHAGLEEGQRIVGVNGQLVYPSTPNREVVQMIKSDPYRTELLLATPEIDQWYRRNGREYNFDDVERADAPIGKFAQIAVSPAKASGDSKLQTPSTIAIENGISTTNSNGVHKEEETMQCGFGKKLEQSIPVQSMEKTTHESKQNVEEEHVVVTKREERAERIIDHKQPDSSKPQYRASIDHNADGQAHRLHHDWMNLSAAELRERVQKMKKPDARTQQLSLLQKYEIIHNL